MSNTVRTAKIARCSGVLMTAAAAAWCVSILAQIFDAMRFVAPAVAVVLMVSGLALAWRMWRREASQEAVSAGLAESVRAEIREGFVKSADRPRASDLDRTIETQIFLNVLVENSGKQIARLGRWRLSVEIDGRVHPATRLYLPGAPVSAESGVAEGGAGGAVNLDEVVARVGVSPGAALQGWLGFVLPNVDGESVRQRAKIVLRTVDASGHWYDLRPAQALT